MDRKVLRPKDLSERTGVTLKKIYDELQAGHIKHVKVGDLYLISEANYQAWINGGSQSNNDNDSNDAS